MINEGSTAKPMVDSGAVVNACMPGYGGGRAQATPARSLKSVTEGEIKHYGKKGVTGKAKTARGACALVRTKYEVADVNRPV